MVMCVCVCVRVCVCGGGGVSDINRKFTRGSVCFWTAIRGILIKCMNKDKTSIVYIFHKLIFT